MTVEDIEVTLNARSWTFPRLGMVVVACWIGDDDSDPDILVEELDNADA